MLDDVIVWKWTQEFLEMARMRAFQFRAHMLGTQDIIWDNDFAFIPDFDIKR